MADKDENDVCEDDAGSQENNATGGRTVILPPKYTYPDNVTVPYANELLSLSFESRHKELTPYPKHKAWADKIRGLLRRLVNRK